MRARCAGDVRFAAKQDAARISKEARDVYVCRKPLVGWERLARIAPRSLSLHAMLVLTTPDENFAQYSSAADTAPRVWVCDFLPLCPTDPRVLAQLLTLNAVPGEIRLVPCKRYPSHLRYYIGAIRRRDVHASVMEFNEAWDKNLKLFHHDCWSYTRELAQHLMYPLS